jgi:hypothetical protein
MRATPENSAKVQFERYITKLSTVKLFSNLRGNFWAGKLMKHSGSTVVLAFARRLKAGCGPDGTPDFLGWRQIKITPSMVGTTIAQFCAVELKRFDGQGRATVEQVNMVDLINSQGGYAHIIDNISQAQELFGEPHGEICS